MTSKQFLAGIAAHIIYQLQMATGGKCGGFGLYSKLWHIYTANYRINRSGYVLYDLRNYNPR